MIFGVSATKSAVVIAETKGAGDKFVITVIKPIPLQVRSGDDLTELLQSLITVFDRKGKGADSVIALLKCSSGRFGSCLEAIKGEAMIDLAACQRGHGGQFGAGRVLAAARQRHSRSGVAVIIATVLWGLFAIVREEE